MTCVGASSLHLVRRLAPLHPPADPRSAPPPARFRGVLERGWGSHVRREVEDWITRECAKRDDWLAGNLPHLEWWNNSVMPFEIPASEPVVQTVLKATGDVGRTGTTSGLDSWYDGATLTTLGGIPSIAYGPEGFDKDGVSVAHMIDEYVPVDGLVACAQGLAVAAMRFCGVR